jgi:ABC-type spermidine/putrescine transport system permease subunit I
VKNAIKGALLSGLVFPGLGQFMFKRYLRGAVFLLVTLACVAVIVTTTVTEVMNDLSRIDPATLNSTQALQNLASQATQTSGGDSSGIALFVLGVCWVLGVIDAFLIGRNKDRQSRSA